MLRKAMAVYTAPNNYGILGGCHLFFTKVGQTKSIIVWWRSAILYVSSHLIVGCYPMYDKEVGGLYREYGG